MSERPEVLIEKWLPVDVIGAESMRERGASSALPPLYFLHVWWARRPLTTSRAAILASVLPAWRDDWAPKLKTEFPTEESYKAWFLRACGIFGDPVAGRKLIAWAKDRGIKLKVPPYSHKRAFTVSPSPEILETIGDLLETTWGSRTLSVLDPFAGGGSIPFEAMRYGFTTYANELNPVASVILKATLEYPARFGPSLADDLRKYGTNIAKIVRTRLEPFFPIQEGESIHAYIWARTVKCPYTGKPIPLASNWWLQKGSDPVAIRPVFSPDADQATFEIVHGKAACERIKPDHGTVSRGHGLSPWEQNQAVDSDYIRVEARAQRLGQQLVALAIKTPDGLSFRAPSRADVEAEQRAAEAMPPLLAQWKRSGLVPDENLGPCHSKWDPRRWGMSNWEQFYSPRQLLALCSFVELLRDQEDGIRAALGVDRAAATTTLLALVLDKATNYNVRTAFWDATRRKVAHGFSRHDLAFRFSHAEFDAARNLFPWCLEQVADAYEKLAELAVGQQAQLADRVEKSAVVLSSGSANNLSVLADRSVQHISTDPPYYDNVMYAALADFFYVWMKRTLGGVFPEMFRDELTNKDDEAVANEARFEATGRNKKELALRDYENKMAAAFQEMHRILSDDGVLTVMFTHKTVEAWDTLATSLLRAGFAIHSSWPVHTESDHSLNQAKKNAAKSTILLSCRKRTPRSEAVWWEDIKGLVRVAARDKAREFERQGIRGADLYIATFGPTLAILSENWPVLTGEADEVTGKPKPLRPEVALDLAREEVIALRKQGLLLGRNIQFDPITDWYLMAWDAFKAAEFPADEARKLALALGLDMERQLVAEKRLVTKKGSSVVLREPGDRRKKGMVDPDRTGFDCMIDAVHTAMLLYQEDGAKGCEVFLKSAGLVSDGAFKACLQALLNAIPRTQSKGKFVRPEAAILDDLRLAFFDDLSVPVEEEPVPIPKQSGFAGAGFDQDEAEEEDDGEGEGT